jgi:hypothetical protein
MRQDPHYNGVSHEYWNKNYDTMRVFMRPHRIKASRHGRYRKSLLDPQALQPIAKNIEAVFNELDHKRCAGLLSDAEFTSYGLLTLLACRRVDAFQTHTTKQLKSISQPHTTSTFKLADFWSVLCSQQLAKVNYQKILDQDISVYEFLNKIRFRGIPDSAQIALLKWLENKYPLTLVFHIPSVAEVFELQKQGGRCISFFKQAADLTALHHERDVISFIIHDLIHAHEFYASPQKARQQIGFYHWLDNIQTNSQLIQLQTESTDFLQHWDYVLSDMNSYCGHLLKTLNAAFAIYDKPHDTHERKTKTLWENIVDGSDLSPDEKILFRKVNSVDWGEADFLQLESVLESRFEKVTRHHYYQAHKNPRGNHHG